MIFSCPRCGRRSPNANDAKEGYCGECRAFTGGEMTRYGQLPLLNMAELRDLQDAVSRAMAVLPGTTEGTELGRELIASLGSLKVAIAEAMLNAGTAGATEAEALRRQLSHYAGIATVQPSPGRDRIRGTRPDMIVLDEISGYEPPEQEEPS